MTSILDDMTKGGTTGEGNFRLEDVPMPQPVRSAFATRRRMIYRVSGYLLLNRVFGTLFALAALGCVVQIVDPKSTWSTRAWTLAGLLTILWNLYWFLWRTVGELELREGQLHFRTPLRRGVLPLNDIVSLKPDRLSSGRTCVIRSASHRALLVETGTTLPDFLTTLSTLAPHVEIHPRLSA